MRDKMTFSDFIPVIEQMETDLAENRPVLGEAMAGIFPKGYGFDMKYVQNSKQPCGTACCLYGSASALRGIFSDCIDEYCLTEDDPRNVPLLKLLFMTFLQPEYVVVLFRSIEGYQFNLRGANLRGANFAGADLHGANLSAADLSFSNLNGANLGHANLEGTRLYGADLTETVMDYSVRVEAQRVRYEDRKHNN